MAAFRHSVLADMPFGPATRLTIHVKAPEEERAVTVGKVLAWLDGGSGCLNLLRRDQRVARIPSHGNDYQVIARRQSSRHRDVRLVQTHETRRKAQERTSEFSPPMMAE